MSFWRGIISAFGFGGDSEEDEEEYDSSLPTYAAQPPVTPPQPVPVPAPVIVTSTTTSDSMADDDDHKDNESDEKAVTVNDNTPAPAEFSDTELPADLFDAVIELFNETQSDFVKKCLSIEAQRTYIINSINENLRRRVSRAAGPSEAERLKRRVIALEKEVQGSKALRQENRKLHLSIERQKRALLDRINDLEAQVTKHIAEKESYLSAKYLHDDHTPAEQTDSQQEDVITKSEHENIIEEHKSIIAGRDARISELDKTVDDLKEQLSTQSTLREQLEVKTRMSDEMINDLRNQAASKRHEFEDTCRQQEMALEQIQEQVASFEQVKARLENRIIELKEALKEEKRAEREAQIARLNEENASLRHTIENNLYNQANNETRLRNEIKQLRLELDKITASSPDTAGPAQQTAPASVTPDPVDISGQDEIFSPDPKPRQSKRRGRPKKVRLDDDLDNTEWFAGHKDDPDFGYHEPPRRPSNDNAAQLSLF